MHRAASKESSKKFDQFLNQKRFLDFDELVNTINNHNSNSGEDSYIDVPLELIRDHAEQPDLFEDIMLKIYNTLSIFFGKNYGYKILRTLAIIRQEPGIVGATSTNGKSIYMQIDEEEIKKNKSEDWYDRGWYLVPDMFSTLVHEFGHVIDFFHSSDPGFHENIDNFSGLENELSFKSNAHNEYKQE